MLREGCPALYRFQAQERRHQKAVTDRGLSRSVSARKFRADRCSVILPVERSAGWRKMIYLGDLVSQPFLKFLPKMTLQKALIRDTATAKTLQTRCAVRLSVDSFRLKLYSPSRRNRADITLLVADNAQRSLQAKDSSLFLLTGSGTRAFEVVYPW